MKKMSNYDSLLEIKLLSHLYTNKENEGLKKRSSKRIGTMKKMSNYISLLQINLMSLRIWQCPWIERLQIKELHVSELHSEGKQETAGVQ
jgi:hypothetical protein